MLKKYFTLALILLIIGAANVGTAFALPPNGKQDSTVEQVKASVSKIGVGIGVAAYIVVIAIVTKGFQETGN